MSGFGTRFWKFLGFEIVDSRISSRKIVKRKALNERFSISLELFGSFEFLISVRKK